MRCDRKRPRKRPAWPAARSEPKASEVRRVGPAARSEPRASELGEGEGRPLWVLHPFHFPAEHAHGVQILHTCAALAEAGATVHLPVKRNPRQAVASVAEGLAGYGLAPHPLWHVEWLPTQHNGVAGLAARWRVRRARGARFYARHERLACTAAAVRRRGPVLLELHNVGADTARALAAVDGVVTITSPLRERVRALAHQDLPMEVIPDGVDPALFAPVAQEGEQDVRVVYTGQLLGWKGVDVLLRALARCDDPPLRALVVGGRSDGRDDGAPLRALARELGVAERVEWTGPLPHRAVRARLRAGDVAVVPTRAQLGQEWAASPLKLFEAMACGLPVVASDLPAVRDVLVDGENGLLVREGDAGSLAAALRRLAGDPALRARLGARAASDARRYTWTERARRILAFFDACEASGRGV